MQTEDEIQLNWTQLKKFIKVFDLMDDKSLMIFYATVVYKTATNSKTFNSKVRISLSGYRIQGDISIEESRIDSFLFPVLLKVEYQKFELIDFEYLCVTGFHLHKTDIGQYSVKIYPQKKSHYEGEK